VFFERWLLKNVGSILTIGGYMSHIMDLLRGPVLGVIFVIFLISGAIIITAFAALVAQMGLLLRLKSSNNPEQGRHLDNPSTARQPFERRQLTTLERQRSPQVVVFEPNADEVVDAVWWQERR